MSRVLAKIGALKEGREALRKILAEDRSKLEETNDPDTWSTFMQVVRLSGFTEQAIADLTGAPLAYVHNWMEGGVLRLGVHQKRVVEKLFEQFST